MGSKVDTKNVQQYSGDPADWESWLDHFRGICLFHHVWRAFAQEPPEPSSAEALEAFNDLNDQAYGLLLLSLKQADRHVIKSLEGEAGSAKKALERLKTRKVFSRKVGRNHFHVKLNSVRQKDGQSMASYLTACFDLWEESRRHDAGVEESLFL
jgi:phytoene dehydrogenase-like protein